MPDNWYPSCKRQSQPWCKSCWNRRNQKYRDPGSERLRSQSWVAKVKAEVIRNYGGACKCCGETNRQFLNIDHILGGGKNHRKTISKTGSGGYAFYLWLKKRGYPQDNYRLLCSNCNSAVGHHGFCAHELKNGTNCCSFCNGSLSGDNTFGFMSHKICINCIMSKSRRLKVGANPENRIRSKHQALRTKFAIIVGYGGACECCNEKEPYFLGIDHILGGGEVERREGLSGIKLYRRLIKHKFPRGKYRLLCFNCNSALGSYKVCEH